MKEKEKIEILTALVSIDTQDKDEKKIADYLSDLFNTHNISSKKIAVAPNRENLVAFMGEGKKF
ncbi:succinyl-diaminopimelate desuccinylase [Clostridium acidisoli DSM 12555]|uniref:Succinyl-diaminopimelate desuccinylase n=1 Tax=Clostridium acidisoli DSM 12555 TaxID=1121291 RepID=A0A1W1WZ16_9CLOT|nr:hypothetical protein [Clostridium acidisoli]SMC16790.1 succinyl-diaminopimelate desuccinylase [Clostridium acidisoli DSM 12555]